MALFKMDEFIKMAIKDEETGVAFYQKLADVSQNEVFKESFAEMAEQERNHAARFTEMLNQVEETKMRQDYVGQYEAFVDAFLESKAFPGPEAAAAAAEKMPNSIQAVDTAIQMEKDALIFYLDMKEFIPETHKAYVREIIDEEREHLRTLENLKKQLK